MSDDEIVYDDIPRASLRVLEGRPWLDAIISLLEPRSPYRPWTTNHGLHPGDAVLLVLDTDPVSVLSAVGRVGPEVDIADMLSGIPDYRREELLELRTLKMLAPHEEIVATLDDYHSSSAVTLFGHTALAAARVLLKSRGRCTACHSGLDLADVDARDRIHIRTVDLDSEAVAAHAGGLWNSHVRGCARDWPAVLCEECQTQMRAGGFASFLDFIFASHPRCPECNARRSLIPIYGMPAGPIEEPWVAMMGCVVIEPRAKWVCGHCDHAWR